MLVIITSIYDNRASARKRYEIQFLRGFYIEDVSLNTSTLQLIFSRLPTPVLTRLSIKRNDFLLKEYIVVQFDDNARQRARTRQRVVLAKSRRIS